MAVEVDPDAVGARVRALREELGLSRDAVARATAISSSALYKIEQQGRVPDGATLAKLGPVLGSTVDYILFGGDELTHLGPEWEDFRAHEGARMTERELAYSTITDLGTAFFRAMPWRQGGIVPNRNSLSLFLTAFRVSNGAEGAEPTGEGS